MKEKYRMKLTKSKKAQNCKFFRDTENGRLVSYNNECRTEYVINRLPWKKSFVGRILAYQPKEDEPHSKDHKANPLYLFADSLLEKEKTINIDSIETQRKKVTDSTKMEAWIRQNLSAYGRNLRANSNPKKLEELLMDYYNNCDEKALCLELEKIKEELTKRIEFKKKKLLQSIENNRIPFTFQNAEENEDGDDITSSKMKWLFSFLPQIDGEEKGLEKLHNAFRELWNQYKYPDLENQLKDRINAYYKDKKQKQFPTKEIYQLVLDHNQLIYEDSKNKNDGISFFLVEIKNHFKKYFPVKNKSSGTSARTEALQKTKNAFYYCSEEFVLHEVKRHIINQLVLGLIQYGKINHYLNLDEKKTLGKIQVTSDDLSYIQVEEAFKKQMFVSISWAIARLNYFYNYGSQNESTLNTKSTIRKREKENEKDREETQEEKSFTGDILGDKTYRRIFEERMERKEEKDAAEQLAKEKEQNELRAKQNELRAKMCTCFPIFPQNSEDVIGDNSREEDSNEDIVSLLQAVTVSTSHLRNSLFHYKGQALLDFLKGIQMDSSIPSRMFDRDFEKIQESFKEQIRSSRLTEYYPLNLLQEVFQEKNLEFHLYAQQYVMMPSFKNVYTKGSNLYQSEDEHKGLFWLKDKEFFKKDKESLEKDKEFFEAGEQWLVYKNLLQLIYQHSFLPAIHKDLFVLTPFINGTINWNKKESYKAQKDAKETKVNEYQYRYADMPRYNPSMTLEQYLQNLQQQQSLKENENIDKSKDKNYYLDFVRDIFARAFNNYLDKKLGLHRESLFRPQKIVDKPGENTSEATIDKLFEENNPILRMRTNLKQSTETNGQVEYIGLYPFLRVLDQRELNNLRHQFVRYRASSKDRKIDDKAISNEFYKIEELIAMVQYTIPSQMAEVHFKIAMEKYFQGFFGPSCPNKDYGELYYQNDEKLVPHRSMSAMGRTGVMALYKKMFSSKYKISKDDYANYKKMIGEEAVSIDSVPSAIQEKQKRLQELHKELVKIRKDQPLSTEQRKKIAEYKELAEQIKAYEHLRHKLTFETLYRVYQIHADILTRLVSFVQDWERDMFFMLTALKSLKVLGNDVDLNFIFENYEKGGVVGSLTDRLKKGGGKLFFELYWSDQQYDGIDKLKRKLFVRNSVAHMNHMTQLAEHGSQPNIVELINRMRTLLAYDYKRQNAVTKAIIEILEKQYKLTAKFVLDKQQMKANGNKMPIFKLQSCESCDILHLKNLKKPIAISANDRFMRDLVKQLFEFKF